MHTKVDFHLIERINREDEKAFEELYNSYFVYLCTCANSYIFNPAESQDIVNETFMRIWNRRKELSYPIHSYLLKSIQNGCLNYLRSLRSRENNMDEYRISILYMQEEYCQTNEGILFDFEYADLEEQVQFVISSLPNKCKAIFEEYLYTGLAPKEIAEKNNISINTVRVHIKMAMDKLRTTLGKGFGFLLFFLF